MANFSYTVKTQDGTVQKGTIMANNQATALQALKERGLQPLVVKEAKKDWKNINIKLPGGNKVKNQDLVMFTRQFATMVNAGVPLVRTLATLRDQTESDGLKAILDEVSDEVEGGKQLSEALGEYPKVFSSVYVNMVKAGEEGGILDQILDRLATQIEKDTEIKGKVKGAMIYPLVILCITFLAFGIIMIFIIPQLAGIFEDLESDLPLITRMVIGLSDFMVNNVLLLIGGIIGVIIGFIRVLKTPKGKWIFDTAILKAPIVGPIILKVNVARFSRTFSSLSNAGVSVLESLSVTAGALSNTVIQNSIYESITRIKGGDSIANGIAAGGVFPPIVTQMAAIGEETGQVDTVLNKIAEFYEKEVDRVISALTSIIEPILILFLGGIVGTIVASVFGPIITMGENL